MAIPKPNDNPKNPKNQKKAENEEGSDVRQIIRIQNTNINGLKQLHHSLTDIRGIGRRFSDLICKKAKISPHKITGQLTDDEIANIGSVIRNPTAYDVPVWMLNRRLDMLTGKDVHLVSSSLDSNLRENLARIKKIRLHRGVRHELGLKVRGQHTNNTRKRNTKTMFGAKTK